MFAQVIQGRTGDAAGLRKQMDRWRDELMPGATGFLGSTTGVTADGEFVTIARFADEAAARRNSERAEQGEWWAETEKFCSGVTFHESSDVDLFLGGGSDDAGFVQVMQGRIIDLDRARALEEEATAQMKELRPDLIGSIRARYGDDEFMEFAYFTSEAEARAGETKMTEQAEGRDMAEWQKVTPIDRFLDLADPWTLSP